MRARERALVGLAVAVLVATLGVALQSIIGSLGAVPASSEAVGPSFYATSPQGPDIAVGANGEVTYVAALQDEPGCYAPAADRLEWGSLTLIPIGSSYADVTGMNLGGSFAMVCTITCPANITTSNAANQCGAVVNFPAAAVNVDCTGGDATVQANPPSGSFFPVGITTVTVQTQGSAAVSCTFTVTVRDTQPPSITCPANITVGTTGTTQAVTYLTPTSSDNCPGVTAASCTPPSGSIFPLGVTTVTCTTIDVAGNTATCSFQVRVVDVAPPSIICPANLILLTPSSAGLLVNYSAPTVSDNAPGTTVICSPPSGLVFPIGVTTITCTATDAAGNTATCSFTITVIHAVDSDGGSGGTGGLGGAIAAVVGVGGGSNAGGGQSQQIQGVQVTAAQPTILPPSTGEAGLR